MSKILLSLVVLSATQAVSRAQLADLKPTRIRYSTQLTPGVKATLESTIKNIGSWGSKACTSGYYLSSNSSIGSSDRLLLSFSTRGLSINAQTTHSALVTMPRDLPAGTCYVGVWADRRATVAEWSNSNNTLSARVTCNGRPNLRVSSITVASRVARGSLTSVRVEVWNDGGVGAGAFRTGTYLSENSAISTNDTLLRTFAHSGLSAGAKVGYAHSCRIPATAKLGTCYIGAYADDRFQVREVVSTDNWRARVTRCYEAGSFLRYGAACRGRSGLSLHTATNPLGAPYLGSTTTLRLTNGPKNFVSVLLLGFSRKQWGSLQLPLPLAGIGAPTCQLLVSPDVTLTAGTTATGSASLAITHPQDLRFLGFEFFTQFANVEFGYNALGLTFSNAVASKLGQR